MNTRRTFAAAMGVIAGSLNTAQVLAQPVAYPVKPVKVIVGFPAGGVADIRTRQFSQRLSEALGQQFVVENRAGASGAIGAELVAKSPPDGYTLGLGTINEMALAGAMGGKLSFDPVRDFAAISLITAGYPVLLATNALPVESLTAFVQRAKDQPGKINIASSGLGTHQHFVSGYFATSQGLRVSLVPYKGSAAAFPDLMAGQVHAVLAYVAEFIALARGGKVRPLAVFGPRRSPMLPNVPTAAEAGFAGYDVYGWQGLFAPAGTSATIVRQLNAEIIKIGTSAELQKILAEAGSEFIAMTPAEFGEFVREQGVRWRKIVAESGVKVE